MNSPVANVDSMMSQMYLCDLSLSLLHTQYVANVDESPAYMGGKENTWRKLNLDGKMPSS